MLRAEDLLAQRQDVVVFLEGLVVMVVVVAGLVSDGEVVAGAEGFFVTGAECAVGQVA